MILRLCFAQWPALHCGCLVSRVCAGLGGNANVGVDFQESVGSTSVGVCYKCGCGVPLHGCGYRVCNLLNGHLIAWLQ